MWKNLPIKPLNSCFVMSAVRGRALLCFSVLFIELRSQYDGVVDNKLQQLRLRRCDDFFVPPVLARGVAFLLDPIQPGIKLLLTT